MKLLRREQVQEITGLSKSSLWRLERSGLFPRRRQLSGRSVAWNEQEVNRWIEGLPQASWEIRKINFPSKFFRGLFGK